MRRFLPGIIPGRKMFGIRTRFRLDIPRRHATRSLRSRCARTAAMERIPPMSAAIITAAARSASATRMRAAAVRRGSAAYPAAKAAARAAVRSARLRHHHAARMSERVRALVHTRTPKLRQISNASEFGKKYVARSLLALSEAAERSGSFCIPPPDGATEG